MKKINRYPYLIPKPVTLVGAIVNEKPNFMTIADISTTGYKIPRFVISSGKMHYTNKGILENEQFSVIIPSEDFISQVDLCGIESGKKTNKAEIFELFYGELDKAPLVRGFPISHGCKLVKTVDFGDTHYLFIGEIIETFVNEDILTNNRPDIEKIKPFSYFYDNNYWGMGKIVGEAYKIGKDYTK